MSEYPKVMTHPNAVRSQITKIISTDEAGRQVIDYSGTADKFPPVTVTNADQEARHRGQGYLTADDQVEKQQYVDYPVWMTHKDTGEKVLATGTEMEEEYVEKGFTRPIAADPEAVERAYASPYVPGRVTNEWPKMVNGVLTQDPNIDPTKPLEYPKWIHHPDRTKSELDVCVNNAQQEAEARERFGFTPPPEEVVEQLEEAPEPEVADPLRVKLLALAQLEGLEVNQNWTNDQLKSVLLTGALPIEEGLQDEESAEEVNLSEITNKDELLQIAADRHISVDKRWSVAKIRNALLKAAA